jgi:hypothetical protein
LNGGQVFSYDPIVEPQTKQASRVAWNFELMTMRSTEILLPTLMLPVSLYAQRRAPSMRHRPTERFRALDQTRQAPKWEASRVKPSD